MYAWLQCFTWDETVIEECVIESIIQENPVAGG